MDYHFTSSDRRGTKSAPQTKMAYAILWFVILPLFLVRIHVATLYDCRCRCGCYDDMIYDCYSLAVKSGFTRKQVVNEANRVKVEVDQDKGVWLWYGETAVPSSSSSFFIIDDEHSSSTTTAPTDISPGGTYRRITTNLYKGPLLGRGSFGSVYEGMTDDGFFIAIKEVSLLDQGDLGRQIVLYLEQEIALLSQFEHENIVRFFGTAKDDSNLYIFLELMTKGSLANLNQTYHLGDSQVSSYTGQILSGLKYLHDRNVVHRDIKCANILVHANGIVKLADFGLAKATTLNDIRSCKGTAFWMAPEVVNAKDRGYGLPADIWSLGCTVLEMLTRRVPYFPLERLTQADASIVSDWKW
ncbi:mitogen-activated protein kinase kinase kinase 1-like isoform X2 [Syzygium oleosum]|uniref:mitogen-activated protein kinase kinase kinase 1-like isoform X2 n=1 Tax=Syzygium oleosum TaxID=219896 RepID=UPI0024BAC804|nr:mitogen-activated protein kinase kinase kinase 1-like isoform X2 [Syzygium oleosum]